MIFAKGDRARYTGMSMTDGECLSPGDEVIVYQPNEDHEDDCIVEFRGSHIAVGAHWLDWIESA